MKIINPANFITFFRFILGLFLIYYLIYNYSGTLIIVLYLTFSFLDLLDGFVARKLKCKTTFGRNFDITVDSLIIFSIGLILFFRGTIPKAYILIILIPIILQAIAIVLGVLRRKNTFIPSKWRRITGFAFYATMFLFLVNSKISLILNYALAAYFYIAGIKFILEIKKPN